MTKEEFIDKMIERHKKGDKLGTMTQMFLDEIIRLREQLEIALSQQQKWTPSVKALPKENGKYLVNSRFFDKTSVHITYFAKGEWGTPDGKPPLAWMPMPKSYKEGENEK